VSMFPWDKLQFFNRRTERIIGRMNDVISIIFAHFKRAIPPES
jgi:hypothetical protein